MPRRLPLHEVRVRKVGGWWTWYCQRRHCLDNLGGYRDPGTAADHGRRHFDLWHANQSNRRVA